MDFEDWFAGDIGRWKGIAEKDVIVRGGIGEEDGEAWFEVAGQD